MDFLDDDELPPKEEDEVSIPRAALNKYIKDVVPDARLTNETRELVLAFCHKFIHSLATQANHACGRANKKTINAEHILIGLDTMGLSAYKDEARAASEEAKTELKDRRMLSASYKFKHQDSEELERLTREQQEIFEQARAQFIGDELDRHELYAASQFEANEQTAETNTSASPAPSNGQSSRPAVPAHQLAPSSRLPPVPLTAFPPPPSAPSSDQSASRSAAGEAVNGGCHQASGVHADGDQSSVNGVHANNPADSGPWNGPAGVGRAATSDRDDGDDDEHNYD